jgi:hypothetical protein
MRPNKNDSTMSITDMFPDLASTVLASSTSLGLLLSQALLLFVSLLMLVL